MQYNLDLNLKQRAAIRIAISFWQKKEVKDQVSTFFESCGEFKTDKARKNWRRLTQKVVEEWDKDILPIQLEEELIHIVRMVGEQIFNWYNYIKCEYEEEEAKSCIEKLHWTPYGTLDAVKIFKSSWIDNPNLHIAKVYYYACSNALVDYIDYLWLILPSNIFNNSFFDMFERFERQIVAYWSCYKNGDLTNLIRLFERVISLLNRRNMRAFNLIYDLDLSIEENMLRLSVSQGYWHSTKYFFEKLTEEKRNQNVVQCARIAVMGYNYYEHRDQGIGDYQKSQYAEICIFLMNKMSECHKKAFFNEQLKPEVLNDMFQRDVKDDILKMLLSSWPWQELFMPVLNDMLNYQDDQSRMACRFLNAITEKIADDYWLHYFLKPNQYQLLLREAWLTIPKSIKEKMVYNYIGYSFIENLINIWDISSLKVILNDPDIESVRDFFIDLGLDSYGELIINNEYEKLDEFIDQIFKSEEQKQRFKHQLDHIECCEKFIEMNNFELLDKFLDWEFETEEEKLNCKEYFKNDEFSIIRICDIWEECGNDTNKAKEQSSQFLHWLLKSEEEIKCFKREKVAEYDINEFETYLFTFERVGIIDDFLSWCDCGKIQQIKDSLSQMHQRD